MISRKMRVNRSADRHNAGCSVRGDITGRTGSLRPRFRIADKGPGELGPWDCRGGEGTKYSISRSISNEISFGLSIALWAPGLTHTKRPVVALLRHDEGLR